MPFSEKAIAPRPIEPEKAQWTRYAGSYLSIGGGGLATVSVENDYLLLNLNGHSSPLEAFKQNFYVGHNTQGALIAVSFIPEAAGTTQFITVNGRPYKRFEQDQSFIPDSEYWQPYVGIYTGNNGTIKVHLDGEQLHIFSVEGKSAASCIPISKTRFASTIGIIEFLLAPGGAVTELLLSNAFHYPRIR